MVGSVCLRGDGEVIGGVLGKRPGARRCPPKLRDVAPPAKGQWAVGFVDRPAHPYRKGWVIARQHEALLLRVVRPGRPRSLLRDAKSGRRLRLHNALLLAFPGHVRAAPGDVVVSFDDALGGLLRGLVVAGGSADAPRVVRLPGLGIGRFDRPVALRRGRFIRVAGALSPGSSALVYAGATRYGMVVRRAGADVIVWRGIIGQFARTGVVAMPARPKLAVGADVVFQLSGDVVHRGAVVALSPSDGQFRVRYRRDGKRKLTWVGAGALIARDAKRWWGATARAAAR